MKKILLVDGNSLLHRAYHGYPSLTTSKGELVGAVYGFTVMLLAAIEKIKPTHVSIAWDAGKKTFRHKMYEEYKAGRKEMDVELFEQIDRTKQVVEKLNIPQLEVEGYEGDDIVGTISRLAKKDEESQVIIATGDRDALQLVEDKRIVVFMPISGGYWGNKRANDRGAMFFDQEAVEGKYELKPKQLIDLKALMGDSSDNIKGVRGVGPVIATKLIKMTGSIERLYEQIDDLDINKRIKTMIKEGKKEAYLSRNLVTINRQVPLTFSWNECRLADYNRGAAVSLFEELEFKSLISRLPKDSWEEEVERVFS
jgi:DNA polymerase I